MPQFNKTMSNVLNQSGAGDSVFNGDHIFRPRILLIEILIV